MVPNCLDAGRAVEGRAESVDGVTLEAEPDVGVDGGGDSDVGVVEFLDHDEFAPLLQGRVAVEWRRSWKRMRRRPALRRSVAKVRLRLVGSMGQPCAAALRQTGSDR